MRSASATARPAPCFVERIRFGFIAAAAALLIANAWAQPGSVPVDSAAVRFDADLKRLELDVSGARSIRSLKLAIPMGALILEEGTLVPATTVGGAIAEFVFVGSARLEQVPVDPIEGAQLEFFSGERTLSAEFSAAALVIPNNDAAAALLKRPSVVPEAATLQKALETWARWKNGTERKLLGIDGTLFADAAGDPFQRGYFTVFARDETVGDFVYSFDPTATEQLTIAQFVSLDVTEKEQRKLRKHLAREQRQGRFIGVTVDDFGEWDVWVSSSNWKNGAPSRGVAPFESTHYEVDVTIGPDEMLTGRATISFRAGSSISPTPVFRLPRELIVQSVTSPDGKPLAHWRDGSTLLVILPEVPAAGSISKVIIQYEGKFLERAESKTIIPASPTSWHPRIGERDEATYDVTYRWRGRRILVAGGRQSPIVPADGHAERYRIDTPTFGTSFALGSFEKSTYHAGHLRISLFLDSDAWITLGKQTRDEVGAALKDSVMYFEEQFGKLPFDELNVVNVPRSFSQCLSGIVTLSTSQLGHYEDATSTLWRAEDPRTIVAHEIAHYWWGHQLKTHGYRDQWMEEALANYAAALFAREKLTWAGRLRIGPTTSWQFHLFKTLDSGRSLESVGPLVLGSRLDSSRANASFEIVYVKGALVLEMLARKLGRDVFHRALSALAVREAGALATTEELLRIASIAGNTDLSAFAQQFIYGTGIPTVSYAYTFAPSGSGKWVVKGEASHLMRVESRYKIVQLAKGKFDVVPEWRPAADRALETIVAPIKIGIDRGAVSKKLTREQRREYERSGNSTLFGRLFLRGETTPFQVEVEHEPKIVWLDPDEEIFARFLSEGRSAKHVHFSRAYALLAEGRDDEAEQALRASIAADDIEDSTLDVQSLHTTRREMLDLENEILEAAAHVTLAEMSLRRGDLSRMRSEVEQARKSVSRRRRWLLDDEELVLEARAEILSGNAEEAFKRLKKFVLRRKKIEHGQAYALLAIAALQAGHRPEYEKALERARRRGIDVSLLK